MRTYTRTYMIGMCMKLTIALAYNRDNQVQEVVTIPRLKLTVILVSVQQAINQCVKELGCNQWLFFNWNSALRT